MVGLNEERAKSNKLILKVLNGLKISDKYPEIVDAFEWLMQNHPLQRASQIFCNYICSDYRDKEVSEETKEIMDYLFPGGFDPFYEEPTVTLRRLTNKLVEEQLENKTHEYLSLEEVDKSYHVEEPLLSNFKEKFNKQIFFEYRGSCKVGTLIGLRLRRGVFHYIIDCDKERIYIPTTNSITLLNQDQNES